MESNSLIKGNVFSSLLLFTIPFLLSSLLQNLYGTVDLLVIGNYADSSAVSAVATGAQVLSLVTFFSLGITSGATVLIGQYLGAEEHKKVADVIGNSIYVFGALAILLMIILLSFHAPILELLNIPEEAKVQANLYTTICAIGIPLIVGYNIVCAILRGLGDSKSPLMFVMIACIVNVAGDLLLSGTFHLGAAGVAIATVTAQGVSFIVGLLYIRSKGMGVPFSRENIHFSKDVSGSILKLGIPIGIKSILVNFSFMIITAIINTMGVTVSAAMGVGDKIVNFAFLPQSAFYNAISVMVAQNMGAGKPERARQATIYGLLTCVSFGVLVCIFCHLCPTVLPSLFTKDTAVQQYCGDYVKAYSYDAILTSCTFCLTGMFMGCGKSTFAMAQDLISTFAMRVPFTYFMSKVAGVTLYQLGLAAPAASIVGLVLCLIYLKSGRWKVNKLVHE